MLFLVWPSSANLAWALAKDHNRLVVLISDKLTLLTVTAPSETSFMKWYDTGKVLFLSATRSLKGVAEVKSLKKKFKKVSRNLRSYTVQRLLKLVSQRRCA